MTPVPVRRCRLRIASTTLALAAGLWLVAPPPRARAQAPADSTPPALQTSRAALAPVAQRSDDPGGARAGAIGAPLGPIADGDFHQGDRILLVVEGEPQLPDRAAAPVQQPRTIERQLSDTFAVGAEQELVLPVIGTISLRGVRRSELEPFLTQQIAAFIKDPVVHARALVRVVISGAVAKPGYYFVPADGALADALTAAGGPTQDAKLDKVRVERAGRRLLEGQELREAFAQGRTLDQMGLESGDEFIVPGVPGHAYDHVRFWATLLSIPVAIYALAHAF